MYETSASALCGTTGMYLFFFAYLFTFLFIYLFKENFLKGKRPRIQSVIIMFEGCYDLFQIHPLSCVRGTARGLMISGRSRLEEKGTKYGKATVVPLLHRKLTWKSLCDWWVESEILSDLHIHRTRSIKSSQKDVGQTSKKQAPTLEVQEAEQFLFSCTRESST